MSDVRELFLWNLASDLERDRCIEIIEHHMPEGPWRDHLIGLIKDDQGGNGGLAPDPRSDREQSADGKQKIPHSG